jgi:hypothetical protein
MKAKVFAFFMVFILAAAVGACGSRDMRITVIFPADEGLEPGDGVLMDEKKIGEVESVSVEKDGKYKVKVRIQPQYKGVLTDECIFTAGGHPKDPKEDVVEVVCIKEGGRVLADGDVVRGSSRLAVIMEMGKKELEELSKRWEKELQELQKELNSLPEKEWYRELERQMEIWAKEISKAGEKARRYFEREILPHLEKSLEELKKRLREEGKEKEAEPLEKKLHDLRSI